MSQSTPNEPLALAQVIRPISPNSLSFFGKLGVYFDRWHEFLTAEPRDTNTAGGVMPVVVGTVLLTILLSITVVPLGVIAALYLREYATQGIVTSAVRIAVNNLAGVPSIVYGIFGLGFFCYTIGPYIDGGPEAAATLARPEWWVLTLCACVVVFGALALGILARPRPGDLATTTQKTMKKAGAVLWVGSAVSVVLLIATTPYFHGLYRADLPNSTFGARGLLWAALTLALLTLPVVIVATEEAIAAVPRTMREGSFGCGASRWQTIRRIVLPGAMPGIMTGMILAMARGAGEVAPLMIVGAVKTVDELPITGRFPFVHLDRTFMHLGFHIFDLGFQSPDAEAARPLVWTTTLLLISIVVLMNLVAITLRTRLRRRLATGHF
jgi:ABC-type phosphate transport system permease subunit